MDFKKKIILNYQNMKTLCDLMKLNWMIIECIFITAANEWPSVTLKAKLIKSPHSVSLDSSSCLYFFAHGLVRPCWIHPSLKQSPRVNHTWRCRWDAKLISWMNKNCVNDELWEGFNYLVIFTWLQIFRALGLRKKCELRKWIFFLIFFI